ncbi:MAG: type II toxin-antitoxin system Phd/YefM family antitoxin [Campylobacterales bacterium]|nr:type II toxin-antitoxin system Phd/YefM family antitoxin [Campylobacterales bacterium]
MVKYAQDELLSITDFTKRISTIVKSIKNKNIEKIGILKNNRLEAVVISTQEYNRLKELEIRDDKERLQNTLDAYQSNGLEGFAPMDRAYWDDTEARLLKHHTKQ